MKELKRLEEQREVLIKGLSGLEAIDAYVEQSVRVLNNTTERLERFSLAWGAVSIKQ